MHLILMYLCMGYLVSVPFVCRSLSNQARHNWPIVPRAAFRIIGVILVVTYAGVLFAAKLIIPNEPFLLYFLCIAAVCSLLLTGILVLTVGALKRFALPLSLCLLCCLLIGGGTYGYEKYMDSIPTLGESEDLLEAYAPYAENTKVAELDEASTLIITQDLPRMDGATALYPVYSAFAKAVYPEAVHRDHDWDALACTKTNRAYERIVTGEADIIFVAGPSDAQLEFAEENGVELVFTPIGREAFVFFVNSQNPLTDISVEEIQGIYSGQITDWEDLGVDDLGSIRAFQRPDGSGSQSALQRLMGDIPLTDPPTEDRLSGMGDIIVETADYKNHKNAIGYSFRFYSTQMVQNDQIRLLRVNGVAPTVENIENGTYPIASTFYAVTRSDADENTLALVEWILSGQGQSLIEATGYTPLN